jgi:hypothetical protein
LDDDDRLATNNPPGVLLHESERMALRAEASAELTCAETIGALSAAEVLVERAEVRALAVAQRAIQQAEVAQERLAKAVALAQQRIDEAEALANQALEHARAAESELGAAQYRAANAEERAEILTDLLGRKLSLVAPKPSASDTPDLTVRTLH